MSFDDEVELLRERGHEVVVYERNNRELAKLSSFSMLKKLFWNRETYNDVNSLIVEHKPAVLHCTNTFPLLSCSIYDAAKEHDVPVVQSFRNYRLFCANSVCVLKGSTCQKCLRKRFAFSAVWNRCYRNSTTASFAVACLQWYLRFNNPWKNKVALMYTLSDFARDMLVKSGLPSDKIVVKPNFVRDPMPAGNGDGDFAVFAGRLSHEKGIDTLLEAWGRLKIPLKLVILGDGPLRNVVSEHQEKDSRIVWKGRCNKKTVFQIIARSKFLIIPSISYETFGRTIIEAYSVNTPVIGSNSGAISENILNWETGLTFQTGDSIDLAETVEYLAANQELLASMRAKAGSRFRECYTADANYRRLIEIYEMAIAGVKESRSYDANSEIPVADPVKLQIADDSKTG